MKTGVVLYTYIHKIASMKKFLMLVILVLLVGGGYYYYTNYYTKPTPTPTPTTPGTPTPTTPTTPVVNETLSDVGYVIDDSLAKYTFKANQSTMRDQTFTLSEEALTAIYGKEITSYVMPVSPLNTDSVILTTVEESKDAAGGLKNQVWQYNRKTGKIFEWYWENVNQKDKKNILRSVGTFGSKVLLVQVDGDYEPAKCASVWYDFARDMKSLDLNDVKAGLSAYMVPDSKTGPVKTEIEKCLAEQATNPTR